MPIKQVLKSVCVLMAFITSNLALGQARAPDKREVTLTGIELASDHRCSVTQPGADSLCRSPNWALASGRTIYLLYGDENALQRFERKRVSISGLLEEEQVVKYGVQTTRRKISVRSVEGSELTKDAIEALVDQLKVVPWRGPENDCTPTCWDFAFTDPMIQVLQAGGGAQGVLLDHIRDHDIEDQVVMLLGGLGDEKAISPIIETLADGDVSTLDARSKRLNLVGNLALTNLTVSEVIWHHGGGVSFPRCPATPKSCWLAWWLDQKDTFKVGIGGDRLYVNYPNYGIYAQF
jgi:hypothetical protein